MPLYQIVVGCNEEPRRHHDPPRPIKRFSWDPEPPRDDLFEIDSTEEATLRAKLDEHIKNFQDRHDCPKGSGFLRTAEDLSDLQIRAGTNLIESDRSKFSGRPNFAPRAQTCSHCGWRSQGGSSYSFARGEKFFCPANECHEAATDYGRKEYEISRLDHAAQGLCTFNLAWIGLCSQETENGYSFCLTHLNETCGVCGGQATRQCTSAGSFVCGNPLCDECLCPIHQM